MEAPEVAKDFPLLLTTGGRVPVFFNSEGRQLAKLRKLHPDPITEMHPVTAAGLGIADGDWIWIETLRGRIKQRAKLFEGMDQRVVNSQHGWRFPEEKGADHGIW